MLGLCVSFTASLWLCVIWTPPLSLPEAVLSLGSCLGTRSFSREIRDVTHHVMGRSKARLLAVVDLIQLWLDILSS